MPMHTIMHNLFVKVKLESTEILEIVFFLSISSDSFYKKMLLESVTIPLSVLAGWKKSLEGMVTNPLW